MGYTEDDDDNDDEESDIVYDDDEDEFGLPSIASMRRKPAKSASVLRSTGVHPGSGGRNSGGGHGEPGGNGASFGSGLGTGRGRANSSDIAEERGAQMYPTARKGEGKILRPQYKEILRGKSTRPYWFVREPANLNGSRSCQFPEPHQSQSTTEGCIAERKRHILEPHIPDQQVQTALTDEHRPFNRLEKLGVVRSP